MIRFKRYPYRIGETYGQDGQLTSRQITMAINKPVRQAKKQQQKAPLLAALLTAEPLGDFDPVAEYNRRQALKDHSTQSTRNFHAQTWLKARKRLFELDPATQRGIIEHWNWLTRRHLPATAVYFAGVVDKLSGDQAKRVAKCEQDFSEWKAQQQKQTGKQLDIFGSCA